MTTLAERIKTARGAASREKLAALVGKSVSALKRWEDAKNSPSEGDLLLLAQVTGVRLAWLKTGEGSMREESAVSEGETSRTNPTGQAGVDISTGEQLYLIVHVGGSTIRFPLGPPELMGNIDLEADKAYITREAEPATVRGGS